MCLWAGVPRRRAESRYPAPRGAMGGDVGVGEVRRRAVTRRLQPRPPVSRSATPMRRRHDQDSSRLNAIHDAEGVSAKQVVARAVIVSRPRVRTLRDGRYRRVNRVGKRCCGGATALCIPASRRFRLLERLIEILKLAWHVRPLRGSDAGLLTTGSFWRGPHRLVQGACGSRPTMRPRRQDPLRYRGFE